MEKSENNTLDESKFDFISYRNLVVFGDEKVGKTCLIQRLENDTFLDDSDEDSENIIYKRFTPKFLKNQTEPGAPKIILNTYEFAYESIFDPQENEKYVFEALQLDCFAFIFLYDVTEKKSFTNLIDSLKSIDFKKYPNLKIIFVGNKIDQEDDRKINLDDVQKKVFKEVSDEKIQKNNISFIEVSLKEKTKLDELFNMIKNNIYSMEKEKGFYQVKESKNLSNNIPDSVQSMPEIRISLFGEQAVGKTAFVNRLTNDSFIETVMSVGANFKLRFVKVEDMISKFYVWDTCGQERYKEALPKTLFQNADAIILFVDLCVKGVDEIVKKWMDDITNKVSISTEKNGNKGKAVLYLVGNKIDIVKEVSLETGNLVRVIPREKMEQLAEEYGVKYFESSCKANINVTNIIYRIVYDVYEKLAPEKKVIIFKGDNKKDDSCCGGGKDKKKKKEKKI